MNRTASIGSRVPPALIRTLRPDRSLLCDEIVSTQSRILLICGYRPTPLSSPVNRPTSGSTTCTPRVLRVAILSTVAWLSHISVCIAGTKISGAREARTIFVNRSSARPWASLAIKSAVAGAMTIRSEFFANEIWGTS